MYHLIILVEILRLEVHSPIIVIRKEQLNLKSKKLQAMPVLFFLTHTRGL